uniref:Uncharacterized protein LOC100176971 n=1 Tax=Phallusia mammillata TaxID=59560 RepID=A0A6F9DH87_9ASCI|nr:uncharacterized protein LOC100176971 [Phallusia mammillata]
MDVKPVRVAGYLSKSGSKEIKYFWCVIRDGSFYVYNTPVVQNQSHLSLSPESDEVAVETFPISHLSATAYVLPASSKRTPTQFALQLDCAKSSRSVTFYAKHEWELERWVDGIKAESTSDNIFPVDPYQQSLLPPSVEVTHQRRQSFELNRSRPQKVTPETLRKTEIVMEQSDSVFENIIKDSEARNVVDKQEGSPLLSEKNLKKKFMMRALPDLVVSSQTLHGRSPTAESPFSSPSFSSRSSSRRSNYQDSADESSLASSITSSPMLSRSGRVNTQTSGHAGDTNTGTNRFTPMAVERKRLLTTQNQTSPDEYKDCDHSHLTATELGFGSKSSPMFYVNTKQKNTTSSYADKPEMSYDRRRNKRHTITVVQGPAESGLCRYRHEQPHWNELTASSSRHSIAPLSSLDFQINQRKRDSRSQSSANISGVFPHFEKESIDPDRSSSEDSDCSKCEPDENINKEILTEDHTTERFDDNLTDSLAESFSSVNEEMKPVLRKLKSRLHSTSETQKAFDSDVATEPSEIDAELRPSSESLGNRFLHRAKSLVGKRTKSTEHSNASSILPIAAKQTSLPEDNETSATKLPQGKPQPKIKTLKQVKRQLSAMSVQMEGWLYRRKTIKWGRMWSVLYSDKTMSFYKEEKQSHNPHLKPLLTFDMKLGCNISNISQDKSISTFDLSVNLPLDKTSHAEEFYKDSSLSHLSGKTTPVDTARSKCLHLMCKSTQEFVHWMKAFVMVNTSPSLTHKDPDSRKVLTLHRLNRPSGDERSPDTKQCNTLFAGGHDTRTNQDNVIPSPQLVRRIGAGEIHSETNTYYRGVDVLEDFDMLGAPAHVKRNAFAKSRNNSLGKDEMPVGFYSESKVAEDKGDKILTTSHGVRENFQVPPAQAKTLPTQEVENLTKSNSNSCKLSSKPGSITDTLEPNLWKTSTDSDYLEDQKNINNKRNFETDAVKVESASLLGNHENLSNADFRNKTANTSSQKTKERPTSSNKLFRLYEATGPSASQTEPSKDNRSSREKRTASLAYCKSHSLENFELDQTSTVATYGLQRRNSDGNIFEPCCDKPYRMRIFKKVIPELTETDFIEVFGHSNYKKGKLSIMEGLRIMNNDNTAHFTNRFDVQKIGVKDIIVTDHTLSSDDSTSSVETGSMEDNRRMNINIQRSNSKLSSASGSSTDSKKSDGRSKRFHSITSAFRKTSSSIDGFRNKNTKVSKSAVCLLPASRLSNASHRGFLDRRNTKKQWEGFWCVLCDSCLYCYNSPQSEVTRDMILLRGYDVVADVTNMNRQRFTFRLEQTGFATLYFSSDNHEEYLMWVGILEKETSIVASLRIEADQHRSDSPALSVSGTSCTSLKSTDSNDEVINSGNASKSHLKDQVDKELVEMQKHKLLKEIFSQQQQIIEDQKQLSNKAINAPCSDEHHAHQTVMRRNDVIDKYERALGAEEAKLTKHMTLLNRRRNSVQLKVDQLTREIAPTSNKKRRQNHQQFAAVEAKLGAMKANLKKIDGEIQQLQSKKQNTIEKVRERQELELLLTEQQENLAIMRRHEQNGQPAIVNRRRHIPNSRDMMTSIDELSSISDCCSSASSDSINESKEVFRTMSTPRNLRSNRPETFKAISIDSTTSNEFGNIQDISRSSDQHSVVSQYGSFSSIDEPIVSSSLASSTSSLSHQASNKVDPMIMADIEMFEKFSTMHLQKLHNQSPQHN